MLEKCPVSVLFLILISVGALHVCAQEAGEEAGEEENVIIDESPVDITDDTPEPPAEQAVQDEPSVSGSSAGASDAVPGSRTHIEKQLERMKYLFRCGKYEESLDICNSLLEYEPENTMLLRFKGRIVRAQRQIQLLKKYIDSDEAIKQVTETSLTPEEKDPVDRPVAKEVIELISGMNRQQRQSVKKRLNQKISLNVVDAPLNYILNLLFRGTGINIIADQSVLEGKMLTIQVEKIPLEGVLRYISRLEGITYSISHETVWITTAENPMLETRIIRLRSGLTDVSLQLKLLSGASTGKKGTGGTGGAGGSGTGGGGGSDGNLKAIEESDVEKVLNSIDRIIEWPVGSEWVLDRKTNTLFARSTSDALDKFETVLRSVDISPLQVLIEAKFIEISDGDLSDLGIEWQFTNNTRVRGMGPEGVELKTGTGTNFGFTSRAPGTVDFSSNATGMDLFLTGVLSAPEFDAVLHAINTKDSSHTLSSPTLLTMNNFVGTIKVTTDLIYIENYTVDRSTNANRYNINMQDTNNYTVGDDDGDGLINEDPPDGVDNDGDGDVDEDGLPWDYLDLGYNVTGSEPVIIPQFATDFEGVILKILPSIGLNGKVITLTIQPEVTEKVGEETFSLVIPDYSGTAEIKRPIMNRRTFSTQLSVEDGCTVVLGGLKRERDILKISRVPLLGNIPILGRLFSRTYTSTVSSNLLIFVSAHILDPSGSRYNKPGRPEKVVTFQAPDGTPLTPREVKKRLEKGKKQGSR